jgi:hypothetical protein
MLSLAEACYVEFKRSLSIYFRPLGRVELDHLEEYG